MTFRPDRIPSQLRVLPQWVCWKYEERGGKRTKVPVNPGTGRFASPTDASTWSSFEDALSAWAQNPAWEGVGFVFRSGDPFCGIDLDDCISEDGELAPEAQRIIDEFGSYAEISPSGRGVKIFISGKKPEIAGGRSKAIDGFKETEVYDTGRFFTVTSRHVAGTPVTVESRQEQLTGLCARLWPAAHPQTPPGEPVLPSSPGQASLSDDQIVESARRARNSAKFEALFDRGDTSGYGGDESAADEALACLLAFWTRDAGQIERIMSRSPLCQREKWASRPDYRDMTIRSALEFVGHVNGVPRAFVASGLLGRRPLTELGNAERLVDLHGRDLRYCAPQKSWYWWDGKRWAADVTGEVERRAYETTRTIYLEAAEEPNAERRGDIVKWAGASESEQKIRAMIKLARAVEGVAVAPGEFDTNPWLLNCPNGTLDLQTEQLRAHLRDDLITALCPTPYDPEAASPRFDVFLGEITCGDADLAAYLLRFFGMCLTGAIDDQEFHILWGEGGNGKSVLIDTVRAVVGADFVCNYAPDILVASKTKQHPTELADLRGKRLAVASELEEGAPIRTQLIKQMTGDRRIKGRGMYENFWEFDRTHKSLLVCNSMPVFHEDTNAVWRRIRLVPLNAVVEPERVDLLLIGKLIAEGSGVLASLARGCTEWRRDGLGSCAAIDECTAVLRARHDPVMEFTGTRYVRDEASWVSSEEVFTRFNRSAERPMTDKAFALAMRRLGFTPKKHRGERGYWGLRRREESAS